MVEMMGIEPMSKIIHLKNFTSLVYLLFQLRIGNKQNHLNLFLN